MKKFLIQTILLILVIAAALFFFKEGSSLPTIPFLPQQPTLKELTINGQKLKVEIADTQEKRNKGLAEKDNLASDSGMLFVYSKADKYPFWMKGLRLPLDFIWIRGDTVVDLLPNVPPPSPGQKDQDLPIYLPREEVDQVLEVNSGVIEGLGIKIGDKILLQ